MAQVAVEDRLRILEQRQADDNQLLEFVENKLNESLRRLDLHTLKFEQLEVRISSIESKLKEMGETLRGMDKKLDELLSKF